MDKLRVLEGGMAQLKRFKKHNPSMLETEVRFLVVFIKIPN